MRRAPAVLACSVIALAGAVIAPAASATQRFASPAGAGVACTTAAPCSLPVAAGAALFGDEVLVAPGDYATGALGVSAGVDMHGPTGGPAPVITTSGTLTVVGRLADVAVRSAGTPVTLHALGERLDMRSTGGNPAVSLQPGALLRDSVAVSAGGSGALTWYANGRFDLRNVTAVNTSGYGLYMNRSAGPAAVGVVRNSVFRGTTKDILKQPDSGQTLQVGHSAFATVDGLLVDEGGNVSASPVFFGSPDDLRQVLGSPTIDAGAVDAATGALDLDGRSRTVGSAIDMGAYEHPGLPGPPPPQPSGNLLTNPGADDGTGVNDETSDVAIPGWTTTPAFTAVRYGAPGGFPDTVEATRISGGANFFAGGPTNSVSTARQTVDVSPRAADIDGGITTARLAGDLGGYATNYDATTVTATFRSGSNAALGSVAIGPATAIDRGGASIFLRRQATAPVPTGTRSIEVVITATNAGGTLTYNDGYADNLSLTLATPPAPVAPTAAGGGAPARPALSGLKLTPSTARPGATTTLRVTLSEAAKLRIRVQRARTGRLSRGRCVAPRKGLKRRCTRWTTVRTVTASGKAGVNAIRIALKSGRRALPTGTYRVQVTATNAAGAASAPATITLRIRRAPR